MSNDQSDVGILGPSQPYDQFPRNGSQSRRHHPDLLTSLQTAHLPSQDYIPMRSILCEEWLSLAPQY